MASVYKIKQKRKLPPNPDIVTRKGKKFLRIKRDGRYVLFPITKCGKQYQGESSKWYIQYRDANGKKKRVPGYTDKESTLQLAAEIKRKTEQIQSGLADPHEKGKLLLLTNHLEGFRDYLNSKSDSENHVKQTCSRIKHVIEGCKFERWIDIVASNIVKWLAAQREAGKMGIKTSNYYLKAFKQFCSWLETDGRVPKKKNPVEHLSTINADTDIRRERRAITPEEFTWLVKAANSGPDIQCVSGPDRAMLYILAAWTGYRREELASLTLKSFDLDGDPPTVQVKAGYSKRRRNDLVPLHPVVVEKLKVWLNSKGKIVLSGHLFNLRAKGGRLRSTAKMMRLDLERARALWIDEAKKDDEKRKHREESDFLSYQDEKGAFADFHSHRHLFITSLAKAGIYPKLAQSMARHSDINLTMGIYSHVEVEEQAKAINSLPAPPSLPEPEQDSSEENEIPVSEAEEERIVQKIEPEPYHPKDAKLIAPLVAPVSDFDCPQSTSDDISCPSAPSGTTFRKPLPEKELVTLCQVLASYDASTPARIRTSNRRIMSPPL